MNWGVDLQSDWVLYLLISQNKKRTYVGISNHFTRRLRQHLGLLKGGARCTSMYHSSSETELAWTPVCIVSGWSVVKNLRRIEYRLHHPRKVKGFQAWRSKIVTQYPELKPMSGISFRLMCLYFLLLDTSIMECTLQTIWFQEEFRHPIWTQHGATKQWVSNMDIFRPIVDEYLQRKKEHKKMFSWVSKKRKRKVKESPESPQTKITKIKKVKK